MKNVHFILCDPKVTLCQEWQKCLDKLPSDQKPNFTIVNGLLNETTVGQFDCIVSPANSYARLDGAFDLVISRLFCPTDLDAVTQHAQKHVAEACNGYMPPGTCQVVHMGEAIFRGNPHNAQYIALCPTMRTPRNCKWNKEIAYNCMWSLLVAIRNHADNKIKTILMTGLGTGIGGFPPDTCAEQMFLAYQHFMRNLDKASNNGTSWQNIVDDSLDIEETFHKPSFLGC